MPTMLPISVSSRVQVNKPEEEVRNDLFRSISRAPAQRHLPLPASSSPWCTLSEMRLFSKLLEHKPVGVSKRFHLMQLTDYMNNIYEDEDTDFEEYLTEDDLKIMRKRRDQPDAQNNKLDKALAFKPKYFIRPSPDQIMEKLAQHYDMNVVHENEYTPEWCEVTSEFFLPDGDFSEFMKKKEDASASARQTPVPTSAQPSRKRARRETPDSMASRGSTPAWKN